MGTIYAEELNDILTYHLSDEASACLLRNMNHRARALVKENREATKSVLARTEEQFLIAKEKCKHMRSKYSIVFTDLVSSTEKMNNFGDDNYYSNVILAHNEILQLIFRDNYGRVIKNIGDAYLVIFSDSYYSLKACVEAQKEFGALNLKRDDEYKILVRMAIHYGELAFKEVENNNIDVYGLAVNYTARIITHSDAYEVVCSKALIDDYRENVKKHSEVWKKHIRRKKKDAKEASDRADQYYEEYVRDCLANLAFSKTISFAFKEKAVLKSFPGEHDVYRTMY
ncbi:MAG: adenylate/guanylate cyclase domain-containing protein [Desulfobacteria bacterium]